MACTNQRSCTKIHFEHENFSDPSDFDSLLPSSNIPVQPASS